MTDTATTWASDFVFAGGRIKVKKTGADLALDWPLIHEALVWMVYFVCVRAKAAWTRLVRPGPRVWFTPDVPRPWYLVWAAAAWGGARIARNPDQAAAGMYFEDTAQGPAPNTGPAFRLNYGCTDVTKTEVARVFERVFGYPLMVDPGQGHGLVVEKGEDNGVHDGRTVQTPCPALPGKTYQKLVDNADGDFVDDLRTPCIGGKPVLVFIKRRPLADRFSNHNTSVTLHRSEDLLSPREIEQIGDFCAAMQMDWGGLDILRDRQSGLIYVVDVNKTDMGPPIALPLKDKLEATEMLSKAFLDLVAGGRSLSRP
ncbi:hypothetical protein QO010_001224 [Caulobacter ginsengisoli]|uniref:ATP-grasp domain-containing protein n=1 Tax=Caulobacter ginsengisoli TaxID=400775 RepID=A0ABU0IQK7_9CAUL|nr:hypothetical protein [Caulobacter ginsengisoli]MDQ0463453.1 hypothetical protein [Caulobacter ginsengisoli]